MPDKEYPADSMAYHLAEYGFVPEQWKGTDADFVHVMGEESFHTIDNIKKDDNKDCYLFKATNITEIEENKTIQFKELLNEVAKKIKNQAIREEKKIIMLVNVGNNHWQTVVTNFKDTELTSAKLIDSFKKNNKSEETTSFENLKTIVSEINNRAKTIYEGTGKQKNGHQCLDYALQTILEETGKVDHAIVKAKNPSSLRKACIDTIITKQKLELPQLVDVTSNINSDEKIKKILQESPNAFKAFDYLLAKELQAIYYNNPKEKEEEKLVEQARQAALKRYSLFREPPNPHKSYTSKSCSEEAAQTVETNDTHQTPILVS